MDTVTYAILNKKIRKVATETSNTHTNISDLVEDPTHRTVTDAEKELWNSKSNFSGSYSDLTDIPKWIDSDEKPLYTADEVGADSKGSAKVAEENAKKYTDERFTNLIGTPPENLDTINEIADAITSNKNAVQAIESAITNKVDKVEGKGLSTNDLTDDLKDKYDNSVIHANSKHAPSNAQENIIESISINGIKQTIIDKNIDLPLSSSTITQMSAGKGIMMTDSAEMPFVGLKQYGYTTQETTAGAQLLDAKDFKNSELNGVKYEVLEDGGIHITGETETYSYINPVFLNLEPGTYTASAKDKKNGVHVYISKREPEGIWEDAEGALTISEEDEARFYIRVDSGIAYDTVIYPMLNAGSTALPWEPYTGGKPSPNPDYPQELISAGDKGSIETAVAGKNLFDVERFVSINNLSTIYVDNGDLVLTQGDGREWRRISDYIRLEKGKTYTFLCDTECTFNARYILNDITYGVYVSGKNARKHTFVSNYTGFVKIKVDQLNAVYPVVFHNSMLCEEDSDVYEPYRPIQTLTHSTPNALPGIPVSSGGNYTDDNGQQWIADYRDWERGVDVQRVWKGVFDGSSDEEWSVYDNPSYFGFYLMNALPINADRRNGYCNQFRVDVIGTEIDNGLWIGASGNKYMYAIRNSFYNDVLEDKGLANWKAHLAEHPLEVMTYLDIPIETPIPSEELAAYRELHTNYPATTIHNDEDCWMEAGYTADPKNHISQHYAAKEDYESLEQRVSDLENQIANK